MLPLPDRGSVAVAVGLDGLLFFELDAVAEIKPSFSN